jgi:aryl-alcohol dehydrogenase-like predicted oxidoreductase
MATLEHRPLGSSDLRVSVLSLGSWRTFERIGYDAAVDVMRTARELGITFLDDARYNDETGSAPIPTGYSEVLFGEIFRAVGWRRDDVVVANKLWWEFWPDQQAEGELERSLQRMGLGHIDLIYSMPPPESLPITEAVEQITKLVTSGRARAWGVGNWPAHMLAEARAWCRAKGLPMPCAAQLPYSLRQRDWVEGEQMASLLSAGGTSLVASSILASGIFSGKYLRGEQGRVTGTVIDPHQGSTGEMARRTAALADEWGVTPANLAFCFVLSHPALASVLFGATSPEQVRENVGSIEVFRRLSADQIGQLRGLVDDLEG